MLARDNQSTMKSKFFVVKVMKQTVTIINLMDISVQSWKLNCYCDIPWGNQLSMTVMVFVDKVMIHNIDYH